MTIKLSTDANLEAKLKSLLKSYQGIRKANKTDRAERRPDLYADVVKALIDTIELAEEQDATIPPALLQLSYRETAGILRWHMEDYKTALSFAERAYNIDDESSPNMIELARCLSETEDYNGAVAMFEAADELSPLNHYFKSRLEFNRKKVAAEERQARRHDPQYAVMCIAQALQDAAEGHNTIDRASQKVQKIAAELQKIADNPDNQRPAEVFGRQAALDAHEVIMKEGKAPPPAQYKTAEELRAL